MPDSTTRVVLDLDANSAKMVQAWAKAIKGPQAMGEAVQDLGKKSKRGGRQAGSAFAGIAKNAAAATLAFIGIGSAMQALSTFARLLRKELEAVRVLQSKSGEQQITVANAQRRAAFALGTKGVDSDIDITELGDMLKASRSGVRLESLYLESEAALSSRGSLLSSQASQTVVAAAELRPDLDMESRLSLVTASLALQKAFGASVEGSMAQVQQALLAARTEDIGAFARNLVPSIAQSRSLGADKDSFRFLSSLFIGVGQRAEDPSGRRTATNVVNAITQVQTLAKQRGVVDIGASVEETISTLRAGESGSDAEKLRQELVGVFEQSIGDIPREFDELGKVLLRSEAKTQTALLEIFQLEEADSKVWKEINAASQKIAATEEEAVSKVTGIFDTLRALPEQQAVETKRAFDQSLQRLRQTDVGGIQGVIKEPLTELLQRTGQTALESEFHALILDLRNATGGIDTQLQQVTRLQEIVDKAAIQINDPDFDLGGDRKRGPLDKALAPQGDNKFDMALHASLRAFLMDVTGHRVKSLREAARRPKSEADLERAAQNTAELDIISEQLEKQRQRITAQKDAKSKQGLQEISAGLMGDGGTGIVSKRDPAEEGVKKALLMTEKALAERKKGASAKEAAEDVGLSRILKKDEDMVQTIKDESKNIQEVVALALSMQEKGESGEDIEKIILETQSGPRKAKKVKV